MSPPVPQHGFRPAQPPSGQPEPESWSGPAQPEVMHDCLEVPARSGGSRVNQMSTYRPRAGLASRSRTRPLALAAPATGRQIR